MTVEVPPRGNPVPDTQRAIVLEQPGVRTLYTHDTLGLKHGSVDPRDPLSVQS